MLKSSILLIAAFAAPNALAGVYVTGSYSTSTTNVPFEESKTQSASASIDIDIFTLVRVGVSYGLETSSTQGYRIPATTDASGAAVTTATNSTCETSTCVQVATSSAVVEKGAGLTLILWPGNFMPFITAGAIVKSYDFKVQQNGVVSQGPKGTTKPLPNLGAGVGLRLSKDFSLRIYQQASPGVRQKPGDTDPKLIWDRKTTFGLTYQI